VDSIQKNARYRTLFIKTAIWNLSRSILANLKPIDIKKTFDNIKQVIKEDHIKTFRHITSENNFEIIPADPNSIK
jgi:predicted phosphatase